jgi:hypothetical protein
MEEDFGRKELRSPKIATEDLETTGIFTTQCPPPAFVHGHPMAPTAKNLLAVRLLLSSHLKAQFLTSSQPYFAKNPKFDLEHFRNELAQMSAERRLHHTPMSATNLITDCENPICRILNYLELLINTTRDSWTESEVHAELRRVDRWEDHGVTNYTPASREQAMKLRDLSTRKDMKQAKREGRRKARAEEAFVRELRAFGLGSGEKNDAKEERRRQRREKKIRKRERMTLQESQDGRGNAEVGDHDDMHMKM